MADHAPRAHANQLVRELANLTHFQSGLRGVWVTAAEASAIARIKGALGAV